MTSNECPTCGRDDFAREIDMKAHHAISHDESLVDSRSLTQSSREAVLERDNNRCQKCDTKVAAREQEGADSHVHHMIPFAAGGPDHPDNLITLCDDCHTQIHREMENLPEDHPDLLSKLRDIVSN